MGKILAVIFIALVFVSCGTSESQVATAIAQTKTAETTEVPTDTPDPTPTPDLCDSNALEEWWSIHETLFDQQKDDINVIAADITYFTDKDRQSEFLGRALDREKILSSFQPPPCAQEIHDKFGEMLDVWTESQTLFVAGDIEDATALLDVFEDALEEYKILREDILEYLP